MKRVALLAVLSGCAGLALFLSGIPGLCADDFMRMYMAVRWAQNPVALQIAIWPPLQSYLYGGILWYGLPALWVGHVFSALCAAAAVYLAGKIAFSVTSDPKAGFFAALLTLTAPLQILLSTSMLVEPMYGVWVLALAFAVWKWLSTGRKSFLWLALVFCCLVTMSRLDGWPIALGFSIFLIYRERNANGFAHALLAVAFPLIWLALMATRFGSSFILFDSYVKHTVSFVRADSVTHFNAFFEFLRFYPLETLATGLVLWREKNNRALRWLALVVWLTLLSQFLITLQRGPELFAPRILIVPGLLGSIVAGVYLSRLRRWTAAGLVAIQLIAGGYYLSRYRPEYDREMAKIGTALAQSSAWREVARRETVGSDLPTWKLPVVALLSGRPGVFRPIFLDPESGKVALPFPNPPGMFLIESPEILRMLEKEYRDAIPLALGPATLLTRESALLTDLGKR